MNSLIRAQKLCKSFSEGGKEIRVLQDLDMELEEGCSLSIVGESGVGKSTLLHILGTLDRPSSGEVIYRGQELSRLDDRAVAEFRNREIGFVFQFHYLLPDFSALENVMLPALVQGWEKERAREAALKLLDVVGLAERVSHRPGKLSGGEQQRVAVARAAILAPRLILADEPTGDLDVRTGEGIQELLFRLNRETGIALVVATHNRRFSEKFGVRMELREGRLFGL